MRGAAVLLATAAFAGCGDEAIIGGPHRPLDVFAASSLKVAFVDYARGTGAAGTKLEFAGSDQLAARIRQGVKPDVYAAADTELPRTLFEEGLVEKPVAFATNRLVLAVPAGSRRIRGFEDLARDGVRIAIGSRAVPVGAYTREVLGKLPLALRDGILANVRSEEPDIGGIVGKLTQRAVDAGFVYTTDVRAAGAALTSIELPAKLQPTVTYAAAVVKGARHPRAARSFIDGLLEGAGARALAAAGFGPPPS